MGFKIEQVLNNMLDAASEEVLDGWQDIKPCVELALQDEKDALQDIVQAYEAGDLTNEDLESQLEDEKVALETALLVCRIKTKVMAQNAANAAINALTAAIRLAI